MRTGTDVREDLLASGYQDIEETARGVRVGDRVRHVGERYDEAYEHGTATVLAIMELEGSPWSATWGQRDVELIIERDQPPTPDGNRISQWADYHTCAVYGRQVDDHAH